MDPSEAAVQTAINAIAFFYAYGHFPPDPSRPSARENNPLDPNPSLPSRPAASSDPLGPSHPSTPPPPPPHEPNSDDFLDLLATQDFSSPSILGHPSSRRPSPVMPPRKRLATGAAAVRRGSGGSSSSGSSSSSGATPTVATEIPPGLPISADLLEAAQAQGSPSRPRRAVKRRRSGQPVAGDAGNVSSSASVSTTDATFGSVPPYRGLGGPSSALPAPNTRKRPRRASMVVLDDDDDAFALDDDDHKIEIINLTNADRPDAEEDGEASGEASGDPADPATSAAPAAPTAPTAPPSTKIKLAAFQCVICMDDVTNLTVTHCGHLFCSECLHSSLYIDATRKICPICRQKVELRSSQAQAKTSRSYFPLELKLMTRTRQGKQPAQRP